MHVARGTSTFMTVPCWYHEEAAQAALALVTRVGTGEHVARVTPVALILTAGRVVSPVRGWSDAKQALGECAFSPDRDLSALGEGDGCCGQP